MYLWYTFIDTLNRWQTYFWIRANILYVIKVLQKMVQNANCRDLKFFSYFEVYANTNLYLRLWERMRGRDRFLPVKLVITIIKL